MNELKKENVKCANCGKSADELCAAVVTDDKLFCSNYCFTVYYLPKSEYVLIDEAVIKKFANNS